MLHLQIILLCSLTLQASADLLSEHSFFAALDEDQNVKLYWNVSIENKEIFLTVEANTTGWIGFGISSGQGKMKGADIVIGWVKDGKSYFQDRHSNGYSVPEVDIQQNYVLISLEERNGKTVMSVKRKFDTCDSQDNKIESGTTKVIYAYHKEDPTSENAIKPHRTGNRGSRSLLLLNSLENIPTLPPDTEAFDIRHNKTAIPSKRTSYICRAFEIPKVNETHHIIMVEPIIQSGHEGIVHHMLLYECSDNFPTHHLNYTGNCYGPDMPPPGKDCAGASAFAAWAIGGKEFYYPEIAGFPIGKPDSPKVVMLEIHYDNPLNKEGLIDSSGLRFHYTKQLRQYDAGVMMVGEAVTPAMVIPPKQNAWHTDGFCTKECLQQGMKDSKLPKGGINVFAALLHTHLAGRKTWISHVREGTELREIARDDHYDFNFQEYHSLKKEVHIAPGDSLINVCIYNTEDRQTKTKGGLETIDEMCLSFLMYYPKVNLTKCTSFDQGAYASWYQAFNGGSDQTQTSFWTNIVNNGLKEAYQNSKEVVSLCQARAHAPIPGVDRKQQPKPMINIPYKQELVCPSTTTLIPTTSQKVTMNNRSATSSPLVLSAIICLAAIAGFQAS